MAALAFLPAPAFESPRSVLIVDDEPGVRHLIRRWLTSRGYEVSTAEGAESALEVMAARPAAVALCDLRMPGRGGLWLAERLRSEHPETAVIIATGVHDAAPAVQVLRQGVFDYLTKPFERERLCETVSRAIEWHRAACDSRRWRQQLEKETSARRAHLANVVASVPIDSDESLDLLLSMLTAGDREAYEHAYRVAALAAGVAQALGFSQTDVTTVERGALFHDLGKLTMPEALLRKPAPLTAEEQDLIRRHPLLGSGLIADVPYLASAAAVVRDAHERVDGLGFPAGSRAGDVWLGARIVSVADAFDTMTRARVFRDALTSSAALVELEQCSGTQFDPEVVQAFRKVVSATSP